MTQERGADMEPFAWTPEAGSTMCGVCGTSLREGDRVVRFVDRFYWAILHAPCHEWWINRDQ